MLFRLDPLSPSGLSLVPDSITVVGGVSSSSSGGGISDPGANGILSRTALNTTTARTLTGTTNQVTITNGDGVSGNPTFSLPSTIVAPGTLGLAGATATHTLTLPSTATGIALYNTVDQTTNYERVRMYWSGNVFRIGALELGGTGTTRDVRFGNTSTYLNIFSQNYGLGFVAGNSGVAGGYNSSFSGTLSSSSGTQYALTLGATISQSGTAGYTALLVNVTESSTGSGTNSLIDAQVGSTRIFRVGAGSASSTSGGRGWLNVTNPTSDAAGAGILFNTNSPAVSGMFQLDSSGHMVFRNRANTSGNIYFDTNTNVIFRSGTGSAVTILSIGSTGNLSITDAANFILGTTNGTKIGTSTTQKIGFWNSTPIVQPTTSVTAAAFVGNTSGTLNDSATYGGYTIGQIVAALKLTGLLA